MSREKHEGLYSTLARMLLGRKGPKDVVPFSIESLLQDTIDNLRKTRAEITQLSKKQKYLKRLRVSLIPAYKVPSVPSDSRTDLLNLIYTNESNIRHGKKELTRLFAKLATLKDSLRKNNPRVRRVEEKVS